MIVLIDGASNQGGASSGSLFDASDLRTP